VKLAEDVLWGSSMMVDRVLHCSSNGEEMTLQLGVPKHVDMKLLPFEKPKDGVDKDLSVVSYKRNTSTSLKRTNSSDLIKRFEGESEDVRVGIMPVPVWSDDMFANGEFYQAYPLREFMAEHIGEDESQCFNVQRADFGSEKEKDDKRNARKYFGEI